ncbi:hypothetical protein pb186bvf_001470 [Paramecium bursaria]
MNYQRKTQRLNTETLQGLPTIREKKHSRKGSQITDILDKCPEFVKFEKLLIESCTQRDKISARFKVFKPLE